MEIITQNKYEGVHCWDCLQHLSGISAGFKITIRDWIIGGNIVEITKDKDDNCLKYDFKINKKEYPKIGYLLIIDVY
ncbi:MAG: hypothetical protein V4714_23135 [Bacteroidota bacterium]